MCTYTCLHAHIHIYAHYTHICTIGVCVSMEMFTCLCTMYVSVSLVQFLNHVPTLCNPMDCSTPGFPVFRHLSELAQTHVHRVGDAIQPSHPLSSPSPPAFNLSQHQGLFQWVGSSHQVAKVLELLCDRNFINIFRYGNWHTILC